MFGSVFERTQVNRQKIYIKTETACKKQVTRVKQIYGLEHVMDNIAGGKLFEKREIQTTYLRYMFLQYFGGIEFNNKETAELGWMENRFKDSCQHILVNLVQLKNKRKQQVKHRSEVVGTQMRS